MTIETYNFSNARAILSILLEKVISGEIIRISRRGKEPVILISKDLYDSTKSTTWDGKPKLWSYYNRVTDARANLTLLSQKAASGDAVEIRRSGKKSAVIISKSAYEELSRVLKTIRSLI